jgi:dUTP pyrophosphatase
MSLTQKIDTYLYIRVTFVPLMAVQFKKLHPEAIVPIRATPFSAGFDLVCLEDAHVDPARGSVLVRTGIAVQLPEDTYGRIAMRSGLAVREHLAVSAGTIDRDYSGEVKVVVFCTKMFCKDYAHHGYTIKKGDRFAQLVVEKVSYAPGVEVEEFTENLGDHKGFGSTGK